MRFFELHEIQQWCSESSIDVDDDTGPSASQRLTHVERSWYANGTRSGREHAVASGAVRALGSWDEALLWITVTGVWPSTEDWPAYYAMRGAHRERRSLEVAPGHCFTAGEEADLTDFLRLVLENGWDAHVLCARDGRETDTRLRVSHDEWIELQSALPIEINLAEGSRDSSLS